MERDPQTIIDDNPMSHRQWAAVGLCIMLCALDGFDVLAISFASPGIYAEWGIDRAALGFVLSMELIGMALGSVLLGDVADRLGRRPTIIGCLVVMTLGMLAAGLATGVTELSVYRFITGVGIGGMLPCINAMAAEYANIRRRNMAVILMAGGYPLGAVVGGAIAAQLLKFYDWRSVFYFGGAVSVFFLVLVWFWLPESIGYLVRKRSVGALAKINKILTWLKHETIGHLPAVVERKNPGMARLFEGDYRRLTLLLTCAYFCHIMTFYFIIKWIPKLVVDMGYDPSTAGSVLVWANLGGLAGCLTLGLASLRLQVRLLVMGVMLGSAVMVIVFGGGQSNLFQMALIAGIAGFFTNAAVVGLYAIFAQSFPTEIRASGTGFVIGVGRGGAALGPIIAGLLFSLGYGLQPVALLMALGSVIACVALFCLRRPGQRV